MKEKMETPAGKVLEKIKKIKLGDPLEEIVARDFDEVEPNVKEEGEKRELDSVEREELADDMGNYVEGLKARMEEIKEAMKTASQKEKEELQAELDDLEIQVEGLGEFVEEIPEAESITEKSV